MAEPFDDGLRAELSDVSLRAERIGDLADGVARSMSAGVSRRGARREVAARACSARCRAAFADIALKAAMKPVGGLIGGLVEGLFTATNPALAVTPFAKGGVLRRRRYFPHGRGLGLAGEAGPEAILPLQRGSDGRLGVAGGGGAVNVTFNVTATDARSFVGAEAEVARCCCAR